MKRVMRNKDHGQPLFNTSAACMSRSMSGMGSELIGGTLKPKYHSDSAGRAQDSQWLSALRGPERSGDRSYVELKSKSYYEDPKDNIASSAVLRS